MAKAPPKRSTIDPVDQVAAGDEDEEEQKPDERPQYRLTEPAYIEDRLLDTGALIRFEDIPGHHMKPVNAQAKAKCKALWPNGRPEYSDPIQSMTIVGGKTEASEATKMMTAMAEQTAAITALVSAVVGTQQQVKKAA